jgi:hypothetical protein
MNTPNNNSKHEWFASGNAPLLFPTELMMGGFLFEDLSKLDILESLPFAATWGKAVSTHLLPEKYHPAPKYILIAWLSIVEKKFYAVLDELPKEQIEDLLAEKNEKTKEPKYNTIIAGMAPCGNLAIWLSGNGITTEVAWMQGKEITIEMKDFAPKSKLSKEEYAEKALAECKEAHKNFQKNGLPDPTLFEQYMQKFNYRITPKFENPAALEKIECFYYNGELNTTNSGEHVENTMRAKPQKIVLHWRTGKIQYSGYFWTDETKIIETFAKFYNNDTQKEGELLVEVEKSNKDFKFSLQDNSTVIEIPIEEMEIIVFKNKFEFFRSENYSKPPQGWRN